MLARNTILQSRYRIVRPLGKGGMGQVYEAIDDTVDSIVAIKETFANTDKLRNAFEHEAKLLASLRHPVLPRVMHHFLQGDRQFLVMDFVEGLNLAQLLDLRGLPFKYETVLPWTDKLLEALAYLHRQREPIIHRDIKPANIKVTNEGEVYLLDFGLAKGASGQETSSVHGYTAAYAPLEQLNNSGTNAQSDLYSLGATLYHLFTGDLPIPASKRNETLEEGRHDPLIPVHQSNLEVPEALSLIISQAMAMKRKDRFASASEMSEVLREATFAIGREREQKILDTPTRIMDKVQVLPGPTEPGVDQWIALEDVNLKTIPGPLPVVPPPPPSDPAQRSWPSQIDSGSSPIDPHDREGLDEEERKRRAAEEAERLAAIEEEKRKREAEEAERQRAAATKRPTSWTNKKQIVVVVALVVLTVGVTVVWRFASHRVKAPVLPPKMAYVPGGEFMMGRDGDDPYERPAHKVVVKPFYIDLYEVTREDYEKCLDEQKCPLPRDWTISNSTARYPVTGVTWDAANAYAKWAGKRLPTEEEWEFAARGTDGRRYPWGSDWKQGLANANGASSGLAEVGTYHGASPYGAFDMVGNAWEWTASDLKAYPGGQLAEQPKDGTKVIRGGTYTSDDKSATTTYRWGSLREQDPYQYTTTGFRCAKDITSGAR